MLEEPSSLKLGESPDLDPVLDAACLSQLRALDPRGGDVFLQRVLNTYLRSLQLQSSAASAAQASGDSKALSEAAHALKSASGSIGALALAQRCAQIEDAVRLGELSALPGLVARFSTEVLRVRIAVEALLARGAAR